MTSKAICKELHSFRQKELNLTSSGTQPFFKKRKNELCPARDGERDERRVGGLKGPLELKGAAYEGQGMRRKDIFSDDSTSEASVLDDVVPHDATLSETQSDEETAGSEGEDLYEAYSRMQSDVGISDLKSRTVKDRERGRAVRRDKDLWKTCLELRVDLEKSLTASHQLPPERYKHELMKSTPHLADAYKDAIEAAKKVVQEMTNLEDHRLLGKRTAEFEPLVMDADIDCIWESLEGRYAALRSFCDSSMDRFHRQSMLQSGATIGKGALQALHQSISAQVQSLMQTPDKALSRAWMPVSAQPKIFGIPDPQQVPNADGAERINDELFTDTDFYQILLNEYLEGHGMEKVPIQRPRKRNRHGESQKKVKAMFSHVHEKLVNFMTPADSNPPAFAKQLFRNLFNQ